MAPRFDDVYVIIPARGGSRGVPGKNLQPVGGRPLLAWSIEAGRLVAAAEGLVVSTDSQEIAAVARRYAARVVERPAELSDDAAPTEPAIAHALDTLGAPDDGTVVLLQPTSPLRRASTVRAVVDAVTSGDADSALTVRRAHDFLWGMAEDGSGVRRYERRLRRQDMKPTFAETGSVYATSIAAFRRSGDRISGRTRLIEVDTWQRLDADTPADLEVLDCLLAVWRDFEDVAADPHLSAG